MRKRILMPTGGTGSSSTNEKAPAHARGLQRDARPVKLPKGTGVRRWQPMIASASDYLRSPLWPVSFLERYSGRLFPNRNAPPRGL